MWYRIQDVVANSARPIQGGYYMQRHPRHVTLVSRGTGCRRILVSTTGTAARLSGSRSCPVTGDYTRPLHCALECQGTGAQRLGGLVTYVVCSLTRAAQMRLCIL
eukprot:6185704-Pleurochrysis_carterae.AAC.1